MSLQRTNPSATLVMRLRHATGMAVLASRDELASMSLEEQEEYVAYREQNNEGVLCDPLQANPAYTAIFAEVAQQALTETEAWEEQRKAALRESGSVGLDFVLNRMLVHVYWANMKQILKDRYDLDWKTPEEMSPYRHF